MKSSAFLSFIAASLWVLGSCTGYQDRPDYVSTDVLVIGGGASGVTAGIQAARGGAEVILVEPTHWLGGMLTSAGVPATDGNHRLPSGLWGEWRNLLYDYYGGADSVATGWVSNTLFEPHIGNRMWNELADRELNHLSRIHGYWVTAVLMSGNTVTGARFTNANGEIRTVKAKIVIDATELGDVLALAGAPFFTGQDSEDNPHDPNIQDITYAAILKDYGLAADRTIARPPDYDPSEFDCICKEVCDDPSRNVPDCLTVLNYGRLPGRKYMLNWPNNGNDYYLNSIPLTEAERQQAYVAAKNRTLGLIYFLQTEAGFKHLGLADDEFPTDDQLPEQPYHREARRVKGLVSLTVEDLQDPYGNPDRQWYQQAVAVGDYPLDHHHDKNPDAKAETFPSIPSFSIPYGAMIPVETEGLIVAEKSISVSHIVNGATRLQPCVMLIGQAAGAAAAISVKHSLEPRDISVAELQQTLLDARCWLLPFIDVSPEDQDFQSIQRVGVAGLLKGRGVPYKWANQTWFDPDSAVSAAEVRKILDLANARGNRNLISGEDPSPLKVSTLKEALEAYMPENPWLQDWAETAGQRPSGEATRRDIAKIADQLFLFK
ncbi:MAG: FAD-dependent oxidoreductase [Bacteroidia bacterium]